jgi:hypothetical protein
MKIIIPIYSMRSHQTNMYSILKDGNFKLHICRMDREKDFLVIPDNCADYQEFINLQLIKEENIIKAKYSENAYLTRKEFWKNNKFDSSNFREFELVTDITGYNGDLKFYNNFNITKDPNIERNYIDEFINIDIESILKAENTTVLNNSQKDYLLSLNPNLKIEVNQKVISKDYFNKVGIEKFDLPKFDIFFPFRISDNAYKFEETVLNNQNKIFLITDPNDSYKNNFNNVFVKKLTKKQYYYILSTKPTIIYNENPEKIFHPGLADFIYFDCNIISDYKMPKLKNIKI